MCEMFCCKIQVPSQSVDNIFRSETTGIFREDNRSSSQQTFDGARRSTGDEKVIDSSYKSYAIVDRHHATKATCVDNRRSFDNAVNVHWSQSRTRPNGICNAMRRKLANFVNGEYFRSLR